MVRTTVKHSLVFVALFLSGWNFAGWAGPLVDLSGQAGPTPCFSDVCGTGFLLYLSVVIGISEAGCWDRPSSDSWGWTSHPHPPTPRTPGGSLALQGGCEGSWLLHTGAASVRSKDTPVMWSSDMGNLPSVPCFYPNLDSQQIHYPDCHPKVGADWISLAAP